MNSYLKGMINVKDYSTEYPSLLIRYIIDCLSIFVIVAKYVHTRVKRLITSMYILKSVSNFSSAMMIINVPGYKTIDIS